MNQSTSDNEEIRNLLTAFDARALGEGDEVAGMNLLAAMALTVANLARPGSGVKLEDGRLIPLGCNLLVCGAGNASLVQDEVVTHVARMQNNLLGNLERLRQEAATAEREHTPRNPTRLQLHHQKLRSKGECALEAIMTYDPDSYAEIGSKAELWQRVLKTPPNEQYEALVRQPKAFLVGISPTRIAEQLPQLHLGQGVILITLNCAKHATELGRLCPAIIDGIITCDPMGQTVQGRLLVTDRQDTLAEVAKSVDVESAWLGRLLWLVEGHVGPEPPSALPGEHNDQRLEETHVHFCEALAFVYANRLNNEPPDPIIEKTKFAQIQEQWMEFLRSMEPSLPGITGTARHLAMSLFFGLHQMVKILTPGDMAGKEMQWKRIHPRKDFRHHIEGFEALARLLVRRMANARAALLLSSQDARRLRQKQRILALLDGEGLKTRKIYRALHLPADECEGYLLELEKEGQVSRFNTEWFRTDRAALPAPAQLEPPLEV